MHRQIERPRRLLQVGIFLCAGTALPATTSLHAQGPSSLPDAPSALIEFNQAAAPQTPALQTPTAAHTGTQQPVTTPDLGRISGVVSDIQGGLIPGAHVRLEREGDAPANALEMTADAQGYFRFNDLPTGVYSAVISSPGLETYKIQGIHLKPGEHYEMPEVALPISRTSVDVTVTMTETELANAELDDELHQRVLGVLPNYFTSYQWDAAPLNTRQKFRLTYRSALDPVFLGTTAITAGIQEAHGTYPEFGTGTSGYFNRYGAAWGDAFIGRTVSSVLLASVFKEDPRYFVMTNGTWYARTWHAAISTVIQRGDDLHWHPAYAHFAGGAITAVITSTYHQGTDVGQLVLSDTVYSLGEQAIRNIAREFLFRHLARRVPTYAKGKPPEGE